jgi:hypothetical protein
VAKAARSYTGKYLNPFLKGIPRPNSGICKEDEGGRIITQSREALMSQEVTSFPAKPGMKVTMGNAIGSPQEITVGASDGTRVRFILLPGHSFEVVVGTDSPTIEMKTPSDDLIGIKEIQSPDDTNKLPLES